MKKILLITSLMIRSFASADCFTTNNCVSWTGSGSNVQCLEYREETVCKSEADHPCGCYTENTCVEWTNGQACGRTQEQIVCPSICN